MSVPSIETFYQYWEDVKNGIHNWSSNTFKFALLDVLPDVTTDAVWADVSGDEIAAGFGYSAGGSSMVKTFDGQTDGNWKVVHSALTFTASGGTIGPFVCGVCYNNTAASKNLVFLVNFGQNISIFTGESFPITFPTDVGTIYTTRVA